MDGVKVTFLEKYNSVYLLGKCLSVKWQVLAQVSIVREQVHIYSEHSQPVSHSFSSFEGPIYTGLIRLIPIQLMRESSPLGRMSANKCAKEGVRNH